METEARSTTEPSRDLHVLRRLPGAATWERYGAVIGPVADVSDAWVTGKGRFIACVRQDDSAPAWFVSELHPTAATPVVRLDDDAERCPGRPAPRPDLVDRRDGGFCFIDRVGRVDCWAPGASRPNAVVPGAFTQRTGWAVDSRDVLWALGITSGPNVFFVALYALPLDGEGPKTWKRVRHTERWQTLFNGVGDELIARDTPLTSGGQRLFRWRPRR